MKELFQTPIPFVIAALVYSALSYNRIRDKHWAKWPRRLIAVFLAVFILGLAQAALRTVSVTRVPRSQLNAK